jgi:hypothetical protein
MIATIQQGCRRALVSILPHRRRAPLHFHLRLSPPLRLPLQLQRLLPLSLLLQPQKTLTFAPLSLLLPLPLPLQPPKERMRAPLYLPLHPRLQPPKRMPLPASPRSDLRTIPSPPAIPHSGLRVIRHSVLQVIPSPPAIPRSGPLSPPPSPPANPRAALQPPSRSSPRAPPRPHDTLFVLVALRPRPLLQWKARSVSTIRI